MQSMIRSRAWVIVVGGLALGLGVGGRALANHDPDVTDGELKCQTTTSGISGKFVAAIAKCAIKCRQGVAKGTNPVSDCTSPFGGASLACITKAVTKAQADEPAKCVECPACYTMWSRRSETDPPAGVKLTHPGLVIASPARRVLDPVHGGYLAYFRP